MSKQPIKVAITGGAGQISYSLLPNLISGSVFGADQPVIISLLDIPPAIEAMRGVMMELEDLAMPLYAGCVTSTDPEEAFTDADIVVFLGAFPRKDGMERKDVMEKNVGIFNSQGSALKKAKTGVKCLVVGNPANTNALVLSRAAAGVVPPENITALTRLDHNRARMMIALKAGAPVASVEGVTIWGNHSSTQFPDAHHATIGGQPAMGLINEPTWFETSFIETVQKRGASIIAARKLSSAASAAKAICDHLRDWVCGSGGKRVSMAVFTDGSKYGVPEGLFYSMPVTIEAGGRWTVVDGLDINEYARAKMQATADELVEEAAMAQSLLTAQAA